MAADDFIGQLKVLGYEVTMADQYALFPFCVPIGRLIRQEVRLGLFAPADFPLTPPPGPHVSPRIDHPHGACHASHLGPDWVYWSRPFPGWSASTRDVRAYMAHVRRLFEQL